MATLLTDTQIKQFLSEHKDWKLEGKEIQRTFELPSFREAVGFVYRVAEVAEATDHHPDIDIRYRKVTLRLSTHSKGGLTDLDPKVAEECDAAFTSVRHASH
ncbi:MAG: 4a-hydroxytetrahydrobiopterin dehydratase [Myxococcaceae bacterium]